MQGVAHLTFFHVVRSSQPHGLKALFNLAVDAEESGVIIFLVNGSVERDVIRLASFPELHLCIHNVHAIFGCRVEAGFNVERDANLEGPVVLIVSDLPRVS